MLNVSRVINSRNFAQPGGFTVYRKTGDWINGRWVANPDTTIQMTGTITVANSKDLVQVPEGDRVTGLMCFYSSQQIYTTRAQGTSDEILWRGNRYRIASVVPWDDFGYNKAFGVRMEGD